MSITATGGAEAAPPQDSSHGHAQGPMYKLAIGAIGIVFGDIGTSPIYAFRETFAGHHTLIPDRLHIYGVLSLIFWSMMIIVTLKYVSIIMRADNKGEGGSLALLALINRTLGGKKKWTSGIILLGVFATALFYGDSMITPAISVLSAVEGLTTVNAGLAPFVVPDRDRHPGRPVRDPVARHGPGRAVVRPGDAVLFRDPRGARRDAHHERSGGHHWRCSTRSTPVTSSRPISCARSSPWARWFSP